MDRESILRLGEAYKLVENQYRYAPVTDADGNRKWYTIDANGKKVKEITDPKVIKQAQSAWENERSNQRVRQDREDRRAAQDLADSRRDRQNQERLNWMDPNKRIRLPDGQEVTVGNRYRATLNGKPGYYTYDANGKRTFTSGDASLGNAGTGGGSADRSADTGVSGSQGGQSTSSGMSPEELKAAQDKINQQRRDGQMSNLPADYKETELEAGREAEAHRPGAGLPQSGGGNQDPGERSGPPSGGGGGGGGGGGDSNLTPYQQWAKNFPHLAQRVKPGQAGYEDIKDMPEVRNAKQPTVGGVERRTSGPLNNQPLKRPSSVSGYTPSGEEIKTSDVEARNAGGLGNQQQRTQQAFSNQNQGLNKVSQPIARSMSRVGDAAQKMNKVKNSNTNLAFRGLPESYTPDDVVMNFLTEGLNHDEESARALMPHLSPEFRAYIEENWAQDWARKAGSFLNNAGRAIGRGTQGKKVDKDANPVHRALNAVTRGTGDTLKAFGSGLTQKSDSPDSATNDQKDNDEKKPEKEPEKKPEAEKPKPKPEVRRPKPKPVSDPKSTGSDDKVGGRLGKALDWASNPKNKDAWMKSEEFDLDNVLNAMCEGLPEPKVNYLKDMDPYDPRRSPRDHAPGAPLPPADLRPGIPEFFRKAKKPGNVKKKKTA